MICDSGNIQLKQKNIAMIGHKRIPSREGGIEVVVEQLSTRMVEKGLKVTVINRSGSHVCGSDYDQNHVTYYKGVKIDKAFTIDKKGLAAVTSSLFATLKAIYVKYDVIHYHAEGPAAMVFIPKLFGIRTIVTIHGLDWQRAKWGSFAKNYLMFGEKMAARHADEVIVLSENVLKYFMHKYNRKVTFIPNGIEKPEVVEPKLITEKWGLNKEEYILFLGRIVPEKGIQYLIEAFKRINTDKKLVIAGGASDTSDFMAMIHKMASDDYRIILTGFVQGRIMEELYSNAYIYVLPSDLEGMPLSLLEAMSYGNCCLVSDIPECTEVVEDYSVIFKKSDIEDLHSKLENLCNEPSVVSNYKQFARDYICGKYCWEDVTKRTMDLY